MIGWDDEIVIERSAAHCYDCAVDLDRCSEWIPQVEQIEKLYQGEVTVGSQWKETRREGKRVHTMTLEVFESHSPAQGEPPYVHCAGAEMGSMTSYYRFIFEDAGNDQCRVRLEARVEPKNFLMKLVAGLMMRIMRKSETGLLARLKDFCEATVPTPAS